MSHNKRFATLPNNRYTANVTGSDLIQQYGIQGVATGQKALPGAIQHDRGDCAQASNLLPAGEYQYTRVGRCHRHPDGGAGGKNRDPRNRFGLRLNF